MRFVTRIVMAFLLLTFAAALTPLAAQDVGRVTLRYFLNPPKYGEQYLTKAIIDLLQGKSANFDPAFGMTAYDEELSQIRLYNGWGMTTDDGVPQTYPSYFHFNDPAEYATLVGYVYVQQVEGTVPLYRYLALRSGDHFFTTDAAEGERAVNVYGYQQEGICCYISPGPLPNTAPLYRMVKGPHHFYTSNAHLKDVLTIKEGYTSEGVAGYVWTASVNP